MNKTDMPEPELEKLLRKTLMDDLPLDAEDRMKRQFHNFKQTLATKKQSSEAFGYLRKLQWFRKEIIAIASISMICLGLAMQVGDPQSALAHSIEQLKIFIPICASLNRTSTMDCTMLKIDPDKGQITYRIRWTSSGGVRVDIRAANYAQTLWLSKGIIFIAHAGSSAVNSMPLNETTLGLVLQPALGVLSPMILGKQLHRGYGLMHSSGTSEFMIAGLEGQQEIVMAVDATSFLPKTLKHYSTNLDRIDSTRDCLVEARFLWNKPISAELFIPRILAAEHLGEL
jgi:hypothetical protein